ncbi:MAG: transporter suffix domain-containing protein [Prolixibacteraceae bacterium]|nr:transporter suffix domain-containing protein [Prolixibacteraceae bacterium]
MTKIIGYIILGISVLIWLMIPVVPFLGFSVAKVAGITTGLIIAGEITFYLSIFLIGKEFLVKIKNWFKRRKSKAAEEPDSTR